MISKAMQEAFVGINMCGGAVTFAAFDVNTGFTAPVSMMKFLKCSHLCSAPKNS